jgi:hypothetical protein
MKNLNYLFFVTLLFSFLSINSSVFAQEEPVLYFCERYDDYYGEIGVSDRFTTGYITVMVKSENALGLDDVTIQYDKYNFRTGKFEYYKSFDFAVDRDMKYIFFERNDDSDMKFEDPGFYRVFLLDENGGTVTSSLIEIID